MLALVITDKGRKTQDKMSSDLTSHASVSAKGLSSCQTVLCPSGRIAEGKTGGTAVVSKRTERAGIKPSRQSATLSCGQALTADRASKRSIELELPLNCFVTIDWELAGVVDPVKATGKYLKLVTDALRKHGHVMAYLWVQERGPIVGQHAHVLLHLPPSLARWFKRRQPAWLRSCGVPARKGLSRAVCIGRSYQQCLGEAPDRDRYRRDLEYLLSYLLKDAEPKARTLLGIRHEGQFGAVRGKRASVSQNLRAKARERVRLPIPST